MSEKQLIIALKKGREEAFANLIDIYGDKILQIAFFYLKDMEGARDICQEVFITVFKDIKSFREKSSLYTWIYRITVNRCYDFLKSSRKKFEVLTEELTGREICSTDENTLDVIDKEAVRKALQALDVAYREVIFFYYYQNLKIEEIAEILNCQSGTIKSRLSRGRLKLKEVLMEEGYQYV